MIAQPPSGSNDPGHARKLAFAVLFGLAFGFLLQKGGVGKFHILIGQLLLQDWTVLKIMLTAIAVGMVGVFALSALGKLKLHVKRTRLGANIIGGLVFGVGFALIGYCPGTAAAALGQGNWDALFGIAGLVAGSYLYAEVSGFLGKTVEKWGDKGELLLPDLTPIKRGYFAVAFAAILGVVLILVERLTAR